MSDHDQKFTFDGHAIFEAMGHIKRVGKVRTSDLGGGSVFVVESTDSDGQVVTEIFAAAALFRLTPVTADVVAAIAKSVNPAPIGAYDLPARAREALLRMEREERDRNRAIEAGLDADDDLGDDAVPGDDGDDDDGYPYPAHADGEPRGAMGWAR